MAPSMLGSWAAGSSPALAPVKPAPAADAVLPDCLDESGPSTPCQKAHSDESAPSDPACKRYTKQAMQGIFESMDLRQLTATPAWTAGANEACFASREQVVANLDSVPALLLHKPPAAERPTHPFLHAQPKTPFDVPALDPSSVIQPHWTPAQKAAAYAACAAYQAATFAAAALRPIHTSFNSQRSYSGSAPTTPFFNNPGGFVPHTAQNASRAFSSSSSGLRHASSSSMQRSGSSSLQASGSLNHMQDGFGRSGSLVDSACSNPTSSTHQSGSTAAEASCPSGASTPGTTAWEQGIRLLLGLHGGDSSTASPQDSSWLVQAPHMTGAMGPIPAEHMAQWLLYGVPPRQLGRAVHRPLLEATAADPGSLLVCGLLPGEVERAMKPGRNAFKPLKELVPGLNSGLDYSLVTKGLVDNRHSATQRGSKQGHCGDLTSSSSDQAPQPCTPTASCKDYKKLFAPQSCSAQLLVSRLHQMPAHETAGMMAAAEEISNRSHSSAEDRAALVRSGAVDALMRVLQLPTDGTDGQGHTVAACWALFYLLGRSKAAPQGCPAAQAACQAANATQHLTSVLQAAQGEGSSQETSPAGSPVSESQHQHGPSAKVQEAAAAVLAGLATTPAGKQAILEQGTISCIVRLLGSRASGVAAAALSVVRNVTVSEDSQTHKTLFKLGVFNMLVHVVARHKDLACKQNALRVLLDLASAALSSPSSSPIKAARPPGKSSEAAPSPTADAPAAAEPTAASSPTADAPATAEPADANEFTADNAVNRLVRRGLPVVLLKLLQKDPPVGLQTRAIKVLQLMASHKPQVVLSSIKDLVEYEESSEGQEERQVAYTGVQVLQRLMQSSTSSTVRAGAVELLQALTDAGLVGRPGRSARQPQAAPVESVESVEQVAE